MKILRILTIAAVALTILSTSEPTLAECVGETERYRVSIETYYQVEYPAVLSFDSRCNYVTTATGTNCVIKLRGALYRPATAYRGQTFPAIIMNHGSGALFQAATMFCEIANYFVPRGYIVFVPFRRGQGGYDLVNRSTGIYLEDMVSDWLSAVPHYFHDTQCSAGDARCYRAQLLKEQADEDVVAAISYMKARNDVKNDPERPTNDPEKYSLGIMGNSLGGAVTVFANRQNNGQRAAIAVSPGAQGISDATCPPNDTVCPTPLQAALREAAAAAKQPAYYMQAKWDYDTRPTIDLAYAHAYGSTDPKHSKGWAAAIFPYRNPCTDNGCDYQEIHEGFIRDPDVWGPSVRNFLRRNGVK
jgi:dienelactone hydrolase